MNKRRLVRWFINQTDSWNREFHEAIESNVQSNFRDMFPSGMQNREEMGPMIEKMRSFYYARMMNTAMLLVALSSMLVSICALVVAVVALKH